MLPVKIVRKKTLPASSPNIKASLAAVWSPATLIPARFNIMRFVFTFINGLKHSSHKCYKFLQFTFLPKVAFL